MNAPEERGRFRTLFARAIRLRCPRCGQEKLFSGWFRMKPACPRCQLDFRKDPGFYLGSIYFNYGLTCVITMGAFFGLFLAYDIDPKTMLWPLTAFCVLFPLWFFRYARSLWLAFDAYYDPDDSASSRRDRGQE